MTRMRRLVGTSRASATHGVLLLCAALALSSPAGAVAEAADEPSAAATADDADAPAPQEDARATAFFVTAGPMLLVNADSSTNSAPSPIMFSLGAGVDFFRNRAVMFEPRLSCFTNYYLWDGNDAHPAEIENRTALVLAALLDVRLFKAWRRGANRFLLGGGVGVLARYGVLANGVDSGDAGGETDDDGVPLSTAGDDVGSISSYLWQSARFLYPELAFCWMRHLAQANVSAGVDVAFYLPLGSLASGNALDAALVSLAFKLVF